MMRLPDSHSSDHTGLSLIELMVAIAIGVVLTFGAVNLFLQSKISYLQDEESARLQENGRYGLRYLARELSMAGFFGGVLRGDLISAFPAGANSCFGFLTGESSNSYPFEHYDDVADVSDPNIPSDCWSGDDAVFDPNTPPADILVIRRTKDRFAGANDANDPSTPSLDGSTFYLRVEDANVSITLEKGAGSSGFPVEWWEYYPQILFVRDHSITAGDGIPALCRKSLSGSANTQGPTECLIEGVENMQLEFGIDEDDDQQANYFLTNPTTADLENAVAARIYLLVRSVNPITGYSNDKTFNLGQTAVAPPADGYYRRVFQTTVLLRNSEAYKF